MLNKNVKRASSFVPVHCMLTYRTQAEIGRISAKILVTPLDISLLGLLSVFRLEKNKHFGFVIDRCK